MPKNNTPTGYYKILSFGEVASCQNLGIFVEIMNKILMIFDVENWIERQILSLFDTNSQNSII